MKSRKKNGSVTMAESLTQFLSAHVVIHIGSSILNMNMIAVAIDSNISSKMDGMTSIQANRSSRNQSLLI
jgi:hypothetical protein